MRGLNSRRPPRRELQKQVRFVALGLCIPTAESTPDQLDELARLSDVYGNGEIRSR